jgi:hypothetical protein
MSSFRHNVIIPVLRAMFTASTYSGCSDFWKDHLTIQEIEQLNGHLGGLCTGMAGCDEEIAKSLQGSRLQDIHMAMTRLSLLPRWAPKGPFFDKSVDDLSPWRRLRDALAVAFPGPWSWPTIHAYAIHVPREGDLTP